VGRLLEPILGPSRFLFVFLVSGIVGFAFSLMFNTTGTIGSSGAVFGLVGALLGVMLLLPKEIVDTRLLRSLFWFVGINVAFGFLVNFGFGSLVLIDNVAHLGGLLSGFLLGLSFVIDIPWFAMFKGAERAKRRRISLMALVASYTLLFVAVGLSVRPFFSVQYQYQMGLTALENEDFGKAQAAAQALRALSDAEGYANLLEGRVAVARKQDDKARQFFSRALEQMGSEGVGAWRTIFEDRTRKSDANEQLFADERSSLLLCELAISKLTGALGEEVILNDCAWLLLTGHEAGVHDAKKALEWAKQAVRQSAKAQPEILHTLAEAYSQNGRHDEAVVAMDRAIIQSASKAHGFFAQERDRFLKLN
jgi:hypothetical protein